MKYLSLPFKLILFAICLIAFTYSICGLPTEKYCLAFLTLLIMIKLESEEQCQK